MIAALRNVYCNWLFQPSMPTNLAVCRVVFFGFLSAAFFTGLHGLHTLDMPWLPISYFWLLGLKPICFENYALWVLAFRVCALCAALGLFTRTACCLSCLLGWYVLGLEMNFGKVLHTPVLPLFALAAFAFSRCGDALSIDALVRKYYHSTDNAGRTWHSGEYTWPLRFLQLMFCLLFMGAGLSKLRVAGWSWVFSDNMQNILLAHFYAADQPLLDWGRWMAQVPWLCQLLAGCTVAFELFAPLALINRRARFILVLGLFLMQLGNSLLLGVHFYGWMFCYAIWIPWHEIGRAAVNRIRRLSTSDQPSTSISLVN